MKRIKWAVIIPFLLSLMVVFFLFKKETELPEEPTDPIFRINRRETDTDQTDDVVVEKSPQDIEFESLITNIMAETGTYGLYIKDVNLNKEYEYNSNEQFYPLSLFKLPLAYIVVRDVEKGDLAWEDTLEYKREDYYDGFGTIGASGVGSEFRLDKLVELMIRESDNTAPKMLKRILGEEYLNEEYKKVTGDKSVELFDENLTTSPKKCSQTTEGIFYKDWISDESKNFLLSFMYPTSYDKTISPVLNEGLTFYHKVGIAEGMYHNCGIIRGENKDLILCLMSQGITENGFDNVSRYTAEFINGL